MLRRLYFVLPDVETAQQVERELLLAKIEDRHMHFLAKEGTDLGDLPEASLAQKSDYVHGMGVGLIAGACAGAVLGIVGAYVYLGNTPTAYAIVGLLALTGAAFGTWISGMIGASVPNTRLKTFNETIDAGHILLMVDIHPDRIEDVKTLVTTLHPEAEDHGLEPTVPAFP